MTNTAGMPKTQDRVMLSIVPMPPRVDVLKGLLSWYRESVWIIITAVKRRGHGPLKDCSDPAVNRQCSLKVKRNPVIE